jgi:hypothetical protein
MAHELMVLDSVARSNLPSQEKSIIRQFIDQTTGGRGSAYLAEQKRAIAKRFTAHERSRPVEAAESLVVGGLLGAIGASRAKGLNIGVGPLTVPADLLLGVGGHILSAALASHLPGMAEDTANAANAGLAVFGYRQGAALSALAGLKATASTSTMAGEDPIVAAAQKL